MKNLILLVLAVFLFGCATMNRGYYEQGNLTDDEFEKVAYECKFESQKVARVGTADFNDLYQSCMGAKGLKRNDKSFNDKGLR